MPGIDRRDAERGGKNLALAAVTDTRQRYQSAAGPTEMERNDQRLADRVREKYAAGGARPIRPPAERGFGRDWHCLHRIFGRGCAAPLDFGWV